MKKKTFEKLNEFDIMQQNMINKLFEMKAIRNSQDEKCHSKKHCKSESADDIGKPPMKPDRSFK